MSPNNLDDGEHGLFAAQRNEMVAVVEVLDFKVNFIRVVLPISLHSTSPSSQSSSVVRSHR